VSPRTPDQDFIDALVAQLRGTSMPEDKAQENGGGMQGWSGTSVLTDEQLLDLLFSEREKGQQWRDCYEGRYHDYYPSPSEAVAALLWKFAFYSRKDHTQMRRLIRGSALASAKFDDSRSGSTWIEDEIDKAIGKVKEVFEPRSSGGSPSDKPKPEDEVRSRSRSLGNEGMSNDPKQSIRAVSFRGREKPGPRKWIVENALPEGHATSWYGEGGIAKSFLAVHLGISIAAREVDRWAGFKVKTARVLYGDFELDESEHLRRSQELATGMGLDDVPENFHYLPLSGLPVDEAFSIAAEECARLGVGLFVVDSVGFALDGDAELAKDVLRLHKRYVQPLKDAGATPLLIDHQAKVIKGEKYSDKQEFGSAYKGYATRSSFQIRGSWEGDVLVATYTHRKSNLGAKVGDFSLKLRFAKDRVVVEKLDEPVPNPDREPSKKEQVYAAVEKLGRGTAETVQRATGINLQTVRNAISELVAEGELVDTGEKQGRSRIVITHSHTTQGTGTGTSGKRFGEEF
jgi:hypothetical protein